MRYGSRNVDASYHPRSAQMRFTTAPASAIAPERLRSSAKTVFRDRVADSPQVVAHEERPTIGLAHLLDLIDREIFLAARALEVRREGRQAARSIRAPSARRRVSSSS